MNKINPSEYWLVRDSRNLIWGPLSRREILELLRDKKLKAKTEIAHSHSYWFGIEERKEITKFFPEIAEDQVPEAEAEPTMATEGATKTVPGEWLSDEYAEEFGYVINESEDGTTVATLRNQIGAAEKKLAAEMPAQDEEPTFVPTDESGTDPTIPMDEAVSKLHRAEQKKRRIVFFACLGLILAVALGTVVWERKIQNDKKLGKDALKVGTGGAAENTLENVIAKLRVSLLLSDISGVQEGVADLEMRREVTENKADAKKIEVFTAIAKAIMRREFLMDSHAAVGVLTNVRSSSLAEARLASEIDNLLAIYQLDTAPEESVKLLNNVAKVLPDDPVVQYNLGIAYLSVESFDKASDILSVLVKNLQKGNRLLPKAQLAYGRSNPRIAIEQISSALASDPYFDQALLALGLLYWKAGKKSEAMPYFRRFIDSLPTFRDPLMVKNFRLAESEQSYNSARNEIRNILARTQPDDLLLSIDGMLSILLGEYKEAAQALERALSLTPGSIFALKTMAFMRYREGKEFEIETLIRTKTENDYKDSFALNALLGYSFMKQAKLNDAANIYRQLTKVDPTLSFGWSWLGDISLSKSENSAALESYQKALQLNPYDIAALRGMSRIGEGNRVNALLLQSLIPF